MPTARVATRSTAHAARANVFVNRRSSPQVDFVIYLRGLWLLLRHPAIIVVPLLAALVSVLLAQVGQFFTDPLGGAGGGLIAFLQQLAFGFAFGVATIYANDLQRGYKTNFDSVWDEAVGKAGAIVMATIGFVFVISVAAMVGSLLGALGAYALQFVAAFFLIYTIPAGAISGLPGPLAISASIRAVREHPARAFLLAVIFILLWGVLPQIAIVHLMTLTTNPLFFQIVPAVIKALVFAYLAFPFAKNYDDVAPRGFR